MVCVVETYKPVCHCRETDIPLSISPLGNLLIGVATVRPNGQR